MPLDPAARSIVDAMQANFPRFTDPGAHDDPAEVRARVKAMPSAPVVEAVASADDRSIPGPGGDLPVRIYRPLDATSGAAPGIVYFHGGGWVICDLDSHDGACRRLANAVGAVVVSVDYRLAPEHKYPAAADDAYVATTWVSEHAVELGIDPGRLVVAGDSAGGNLAAVVALMARDRNGPPIAFQLLIYPVIDSTTERNEYPSKIDNGEGFFLTTAQMNWYRNHYVADDAAGELPYVSPNRARSFAGLPQACVVTAEMDPLRDEGNQYAQTLAAAGVHVTAHEAPGMFHGFFSMDALLDGAKEAQQVAFSAMRDALGTGNNAEAGA